MLTREDDVDAHALRRQGWTISAIARHLGHDRKTIRSYLVGGRVAGERTLSSDDPLGPFVGYLRQRLVDDPHERRGLLPAPQRSLGGHREYDREAVTVLRVIRGLARLGFTLDEISELIAVGSHRGPRPGLRDAAAAKLVEVDAKIADLQQVHATLAAVLTAGCSDLENCSCDPACPIPFIELTPHVAGLTGCCPEHNCGAGAVPGDGSATSSMIKPDKPA